MSISAVCDTRHTSSGRPATNATGAVVAPVLFFVALMQRSRLSMTLRILALLCCLPALMGAEIYRYVDANGVVNYVQQLPYGVQGERIQTNAGAPVIAEKAQPPTTNAPAQPKLDPQQQAMLDELNKKEKARRDEIARIRQDNCKRSRQVLERLSVAGRVRVNDPDGTQRMMPEDERQQRIAEAQKGIVTNCSPEPTDTASASGGDTAKAAEPAVAANGG
jgi:hypothetical protein